jgi:glucokinase
VTVTIGLDVGGTKIAAGLVDDHGTVLARARHATPSRDANASVTVMADLVRYLAAQAKSKGLPEPEAIGVGAAALVDVSRRVVLFTANLGWQDVPLAELLEKASGLPVVVENDANAACWGEFQFGAGRASDFVACVTVGTGLGGGLVDGGRLLRGAYGIAAEIGHVIKVPNGLPCGCGRRGCWEQYASGNALVRVARGMAAERRTEAANLLQRGDGTPEGVQGQHITAAAQAGDPVAVAAFQQIGGWLGRGLADLAALVDPELFVIGGGVIDAGELLLGPARIAFEQNLVGAGHRPVAGVVAAQLGNDAGIVGAADLARVRGRFV